MRKLLLTLLVLTFHQLVLSQNKAELITIEFKEASRETILESIEKSTSYEFFFDTEWFKTDKTLISGNYKNISIEDLLEKIFDNTNFNYFVEENRIILTKNSAIYDTLIPDYSSTTTENSSKSTDIPNENPIFFQEYDSTSTISSKKNNAVALIGKDKKINNKKYYTLSGYIKDDSTEKPLSNITIRVKNQNVSSVTNSEGFFTIQLPAGINQIETESLNHSKTTKSIVVYDNGKLDLYIKENINDLDEVIIKGKTNKNVREAITGVSTIDVEGIKNVPLVLGERDIFRVAATLPGIKTTGEGSAGYNVRGGKDDQNLILVDNAVLYNSSHFLGFFSAVNPYTTSKVDIYKGSIPAQYGGRLSSVFDITSKKGSQDKLTGEGGIGIVTSNLTISTPIVKDKSSLLVGIRGTYSEWLLNNVKDESLQNSQASFYDGTIKYNHQLNKSNGFETTFYYSHDSFNISSDSTYKYSNRLFTAKWDHSFNEKNKAAVIFTNSQYNFNIEYEPIEPINAFDYGYKLNESQILLNLKYLQNEKHNFSYGISSKLYNIDPGHLNPSNPESNRIPINIQDEKALESAFYIADNYTINGKFLLNFGLRYSYYAALGPSVQNTYQENSPLNNTTVTDTNTYKNNEIIKTYGGFEPRAAIRYLIKDDLSVKASYDKTFQYIHLLTSNTTQTPLDAWKLSDLNIKPQEAQQFSLGIFQNIKNDLLQVSLEGYYKRSQNLLDYKVGGELVLKENIEAQLLQGEGKAYGVELLLKKQIGKLNGWLGYTYSRTFIKLDSEFNEEKVNNGEYFPTNFDKPHEVSAVLNYKITKRYSFSSNFIYQSGRPITYPIGSYHYGNANYTLYSDRNKFRIPDYYRLDVGINIEGNHKIKKLAHSFWNISVYNVLGRNNPYSIYFVTQDGKIKAYKTSIFAVPIPSITYNFKF